MMKNQFYLAVLLLIFTLSCNDDENPIVVIHDQTPYNINLRHFPTPALPADNVLTEQGVKLGKMLFFEKKLSRDNSQACAGCHVQSDAFTDTTRFSLGVRNLPGNRQAMSVFNMAWHTNEFFWDGRAHLLRDQALQPIQDPLEMDETLENVIQKLKDEQLYKDQFIRAFGSDEITEIKMALAMEQFMLSIVSNDSKYDKHLRGETQLTESEMRGLKLFTTEYNPFFPDESGADCEHCHGGINFENDRYMNNGLDSDADITDIGRQAVTNQIDDRAKFKVPSLRNIALTPPYMHDGRFSTLEEVIDHYDHGLRISNTLDPALLMTTDQGLLLTDQDKNDLINFLHTLSDDTFLSNPEYADPF